MFERKLFYEDRGKYNTTLSAMKEVYPSINDLAKEYEALGLGPMNQVTFEKFFKFLKLSVRPAEEAAKALIRKEYGVVVDIQLAKNQVPKALREHMIMAAVGGRNPATSIEIDGDVKTFVEKFEKLYGQYHQLTSWNYAFVDECISYIEVKNGKASILQESQDKLLETYQIFIKNEKQDKHNELMLVAQKAINDLSSYLRENNIPKTFDDCIFFKNGKAVINVDSMKY